MNKYIDLTNSTDYTQLIEPAKIIKDGGIALFPTDTVYGIGANAFDENALKKLYQIKQRPIDKPISVLASDMNMVESIAKDITPLEYKLMESFFPGPLTIVLKKKDNIPNIITANTDTIGIRIPDEKITTKLIQLAGVPIATTSANISGRESGTDIESILYNITEPFDVIINNGKSKLGIASTVVKIIDNTPYILREGSISKEQIYKVLKKQI